MSIPYIFSSGIIVVILVLIGILYTFREFKEMERNPGHYRRDRTDNAKVHKK
jgi:hypothetical protein